MANKDLNIVIKAKDEASKSIGKLGGALDGFKKKFGQAGETMKQVGKIGFTAIAGITAGLTASVKSMANFGDEMAKMSDRTGIGVETLSALQHAANLSGTSMGTLENAMKKTAVFMGQLEEGGAGVTRNLDRLGLSVGDIQGLNPEDTFKKLAFAVADIEDPLMKADLAMQVFGKAGTEMLPMLKGGSEGLEDMMQEARRLGLVLDEETARASEEFNDTIERLTASVTGIKNEIGKAFLPILQELLNEYEPLIMDLQESIRLWIQNEDNIAKLKGAIDSFITVIKITVTTIKFLIKALYSIGGALGEIAFDIYSFVQTTISAFQKISEVVSNLWSGLWEGVKNIMGLAVDWLTSKFEALKAFIEGIIGFATGAFDRVKAIGESAQKIGSSIGGAVSNAVGTVTGQRELGGPVSANKTYLVGERGPELFTPATSGRINNQTGGAGNITINMGGVVVNNEADENRLIEKMKRALIRETQLFNNGIA